MAQNQTYRSGPQSVVSGLIESGVVVEVGDLVAVVDDFVVSGREFTNAGGSGGPTLTDFQEAFLGVLIEGATGGDEGYNTRCLVATSGDFEYPLDSPASGDLPPGTPIEAVIASTLIDPQTVAEASDRETAIALTSRETLEGATTVTIRINSGIMGVPFVEPA